MEDNKDFYQTIDSKLESVDNDIKYINKVIKTLKRTLDID